ncbi:unnamed protein product [Schistocephalus solidus]|uniref:Secreted protein n=1 Tax=Schistocephalus solidus TaxID=70667 RepID=A0A183TI76_SCHSO|nr:unnamed protein product [Schistocephalus solidus]
MAISCLLAVIFQPYPTLGAAAPEARTRDLVGQKSNALPTKPRARCLAMWRSIGDIATEFSSANNVELISRVSVFTVLVLHGT